MPSNSIYSSGYNHTGCAATSSLGYTMYTCTFWSSRIQDCSNWYKSNEQKVKWLNMAQDTQRVLKNKERKMYVIKIPNFPSSGYPHTGFKLKHFLFLNTSSALPNAQI